MLVKITNGVSLCSVLLGHYTSLALARQTTSYDSATQHTAITTTAPSSPSASVQPTQLFSQNNPFRLIVPPSEPVCCLIPLHPIQPDPDPADDLLPFEEWKARQLALSSTEIRTTDYHTPTVVAPFSEESTVASETTSTILIPVVETVGEAIPEFFPIEGRFNYASVDCTARVHSAGKSMKSASSILSSKKDKYMLAPCSAKNKHIVVELCDDIRVDTVQLANFEFFSGVFKDIAIYLGRTNNPHSPKLNWVGAGVFRAKNVRGIQTFRLYNLPNTFDRYIRIEFLSHYGKEYFCPVSLLRVYGLTQMEDWRIEEWKQEWQARRPAGLTISSADEEDSLISRGPPTEESTHHRHQKGEGISVETSYRTDPSGTPTPTPLVTNDTTVSSGSNLRTNDSAFAIPRNSSVDSRNPVHSNITETLNSSSNSAEDHKPTATDSNMKSGSVRPSKSKTQESASPTSPMLKATQIATPIPSTGGESIYRTIWNRLEMLERGSTLSLRYVEEQNQSVRQALRRLEEEVGRLRALTNREQQELQRSMRSVQQKQMEMEKRWNTLLEQVNALAEEVVLEKRLGIAQLCLLTTVLVFMALTRGSRAETHLLSGMRRRVDSGLGLGRGFYPSYLDPTGGSPFTPVHPGPPPQTFGTPSGNASRSPSRTESRSPSKPPTKGVRFPQGVLPFPSLRPAIAGGVRRSQSMSLPNDQLVISPSLGKRPATGMKRLARTAHLHEVELDTQRRLRMQEEPAEKDNDIDHSNHDTEPLDASSMLDSAQSNDASRTSDIRHLVKQQGGAPARKVPAGVLGRRFAPTQPQYPDNGTEWEDTDVDLDVEDPMQEIIVEENMHVPRVPRLVSPPTPRTWGARRKARGFSVDTGSAIRMQCA
ncbi:Sad1 / UNC-like C-terminal [Rhizoctonia solani]|uniref:Sad1 / UNC-like C-terminal n=1 Tax=Rhizoctonia solani TaxID=456999 RepID=A0A8H7H8F0_9AGAM|nr:Sad1 / UNC-like C-terminal [Rhizoctonia solani]